MRSWKAIFGLPILGLWSLAGGQQPPTTQPPQPPSAQQPAQPAPAPQDNQEQPLPRFKGGLSEVVLGVTVTDDRGYFVRDLEVNDFRVLDEGRPARITFFKHDPKQPIVFGFLVDLSNNSRIHWKNYKEAIKELIWDLQLTVGAERFSGYLITYANEAELAVDTTQDATKLTDRVEKMQPGGGSAMYDAIAMACNRRSLVKGEPYEPRRVIIVIGDGHDNASRWSLAEVLELAKRKFISIIGMSTVAYAEANPDADTLEKIATETGGIVEYPLNKLYRDVSGYVSIPTEAGNYVYEAGTGGYASEVTKGIMRAVTGIVSEVTTQYVIYFQPDLTANPARVFRRISVDIPSLPNARIHARDGYYPDGEVASRPAANPGQ